MLTCICRLLLTPPPHTADFQPSLFFTQQLTAFELWLQHGSRDKKPPEQLPIVLQVCASYLPMLSVPIWHSADPPKVQSSASAAKPSLLV